MATLMTMPKTAVHQNRAFPTRQYDVWTAGQLAYVEPIAKAHSMK